MAQTTRHPPRPWAYLTLFGLLLTTALLSGLHAQSVGVTTENKESHLQEDAPAETDPQRQEFERRWFKHLLIVILLLISALFGLLLIITLLRQGRWRRRNLKIGAPPSKTEYIDAWSQYRLKDEDIPGNDITDAPPESDNR